MPRFCRWTTILIPAAEHPFVTGRFQAMGCPCEILIDTTDSVLAAEQLSLGRQEALRIEEKYSRYLQGSVVDHINQSGGSRVRVDDETAALLDYAQECFELSGGLFDITTGALRKGANPAQVGWNKVSWRRPF